MNEEYFILECSEEDFEKMNELFKSGELNKIFIEKNINAEVTSLGLKSRKFPPRNILLSEWLKDGNQSNRETKRSDKKSQSKDFMFRGNDNSDYNDSTKYKTTYNLGKKFNNGSIELTVDIKVISEDEVNVFILIQQANNRSFLMSKVKAILLQDSQVVKEFIPKVEESFIEIDFNDEIGEKFSLKIELDDYTIMEEFII